MGWALWFIAYCEGMHFALGFTVVLLAYSLIWITFRACSKVYLMESAGFYIFLFLALLSPRVTIEAVNRRVIIGSVVWLRQALRALRKHPIQLAFDLKLGRKSSDYSC